MGNKVTTTAEDRYIDLTKLRINIKYNNCSIIIY